MIEVANRKNGLSPTHPTGGADAWVGGVARANQVLVSGFLSAVPGSAAVLIELTTPGENCPLATAWVAVLVATHLVDEGRVDGEAWA